MYLHIGKNLVIEEKKVIGIFDINVLQKSKEYIKMYNKIEEKIVDISDGIQKSLVLLQDKNTCGYITNISSITLRKR